MASSQRKQKEPRGRGLKKKKKGPPSQELRRNASLPPAAWPRFTFEPFLQNSRFSQAEGRGGRPLPRPQATRPAACPGFHAGAMGSQVPRGCTTPGRPWSPPLRRGRGGEEPGGPGRPGVVVSCSPPSAPPTPPGLAGAPSPQPAAPARPHASGRPRPRTLQGRRQASTGRLVSKHNGARAPRPLNRAEGRRQQHGPAAPGRHRPPFLGTRGPRRPLTPLPIPSSHPRPPRGPYLVESPVGAANLHRQLRHVGTAKAAGKRF